MSDINLKKNGSPKIKPGPRKRNSSDVTVAQAEASPQSFETSREHQAHSGGRTERQRIRMNAGLNLDVPAHLLDTDKYHYRWMSDQNGKLSRAEQAAYEFVTNEDGSKITRAGATMLYLMRLPLSFRVQDLQESRNRRINSRREAASLAEGDYTPNDNGKSVQSLDSYS